jgi:hypothetical protein
LDESIFPPLLAFTADSFKIKESEREEGGREGGRERESEIERGREGGH